MTAPPARIAKTRVVSGPGDDTDERLYVASVEKAMRVLSVFGPDRRWMSLAEIAAASGIGTSPRGRSSRSLPATPTWRKWL